MVIWCHDMDKYLKMIDNQRGQQAGFSQAGSRLIKCLQYMPTSPSDCAAPIGVPETLYDQQWLASVDTDSHEVTLDVYVIKWSENSECYDDVQIH